MLQDELNTAIHSLRGALLELVTGAGGDPGKPQVVSRKFGIDKSLAWKVSRVISASEPDLAIAHMPGEAGMDIFLDTLQKSGAKAAAVKRARSAVTEFRSLVTRQLGDRPTLEIVLDAMPSRKQDRLLMSRKLSFRGNSGIWGVQARARIETIVMSPNAGDPSLVDVVKLSAWIDFRRIRPDIRWTLFRFGAFRDGELFFNDRPIDRSADDGSVSSLLLKSFCTAGTSAIEIGDFAGGNLKEFQLGPGPVGNTGAFTCYCAGLTEKLGSRYTTEPDERADFFCAVHAPVESLTIDLIAHRDLSFASSPRFSCYGMHHVDPSTLQDNQRLPLSPESTQLGLGLPLLALPAVPEYRRAIQFAFDKLGWSMQQFIGTRFALDYPPFPSTTVVSCPLEFRGQPANPASNSADSLTSGSRAVRPGKGSRARK
jgi:hypothetical protein